MKIGRIHYANTAPYFAHSWPEHTLIPGAPRALAEMARQGLVDAAPLPVVETWDMIPPFEALGHWGIGATERCRSVFLASQKPLKELDGAEIAVTSESSTSVRLCSVLLALRYGVSVRFRRGRPVTEPAYLMIGDEALRAGLSPSQSGWKYLFDLAAEWNDWQRVPFVFARWVVRSSLPAAEKKALQDELQASLMEFENEPLSVAIQAAPGLGLDAASLRDYLMEIDYSLTYEHNEGEARFRELSARALPVFVDEPAVVAAL